MKKSNNNRLISLQDYKRKTFSEEKLEEMRREYPNKVKEWRAEAMQEIADKIRRSREESGLTQEDIADLLHITRGNVVQIESGSRNITIETLKKIARVMGKELVVDFK